jgi:hypothetical protein
VKYTYFTLKYPLSTLFTHKIPLFYPELWEWPNR